MKSVSFLVEDLLDYLKSDLDASKYLLCYPINRDFQKGPD